MKPSEAKKLISILNQQIDTSKPIEPQLDEMFTVWRETVVEKRSWKGRIIAFTTTPFHYTKQQRKVYGCFAEALAMESIQLEHYSVEVQNFFSRAIRRLSYEPKSAISEALSATPEIDKLIQEKLKAKRELNQRRFEESLLRIPSDQESLSKEAIEGLFNDQNLDDEKLNILERYLRTNPALAADGWEEHLEKLKESVVLEREYTAKLKEANPMERHDFLCNEAINLHNKVHSLDPLSGESVFYVHHYGNRGNLTDSVNLNGMLSVLKKLPPEEIENLPEIVKKAIQDGEFPKIESLVEDLVGKALTKMTANPEKNKEILESLFQNNLLMSVLFPEDSRQIPEKLALILPEILQSCVNQKLKEGVALNLASLLGQNKIATVLKWWAENGEKIQKNPESAEVRKLVTDQIMQILGKIENKINNEIYRKLSSHLDRAIPKLPSFIFEMTRTESLFLKGDIWLEFFKEDDGTFRIAIYTMGHAQEYHPDSKVCLGIKKIEAGRLDILFFENLLKRNWESLWNSEMESTAHDFYHGPLQGLNGVLDREHPEKESETTTINSNFHLALYLLTKRSESVQGLLFDIQFEFFVDYCRHNLMRNGVISIDKENMPFVQKTYNRLKKNYNELKNLPAYAEKNKAIEATLEEIKAEVDETILAVKTDRQNKENNDFLQHSIKESLEKSGFNKDRILQFESILKWIFGDAMNYIIDPLVDQVLPLAPNEKIEAQVSKKVDVPIEGTYATLYLQLAWKIARLTMLGAGFYSGGFWTFMSIPGLLSLLPYILPEKHYQFYCDTMEGVRFSISKMLFNLCWNYVLNDSIKTKLDECKNELKKNLNNLINPKDPQELNFSLNPFEHENNQNEEIPDNQVDDSYLPELVSSVTPVQFKPGMPLVHQDSRLILNPENIGESLNGIKFKFSFLEKIEAIRTLPLPGPGSVWSTISNPDKTISDLYALSEYIVQNLSLPTPRQINQLVPALYKIQAIMYHIALANRVDSFHPLERGFRPDCTPLLKWYCEKDTIITDPVDQEEVENLIKILIPEINLNRITPSILEELTNYNRDRLWSWNTPETYLDSTIYSRRTISRHLHQAYYKGSIEEEYLEETCNRIQADSRFENLSAKDRMNLIRYHSFNPDSQKPIIGKRFCQLKRLTLLCAKAVQFSYPNETLYHAEVKAAVLENLVTSLSERDESQPKISQNNEIENLIKFYYRYSHRQNVLRCPRETQMQIASESHGVLSKEIQKQLIWVEPGESIIQAIDYYRDSLTNLVEIKKFESILFMPGSLKAVLENAPQTVLALENTLKTSLSANWENKNYGLILSILSLSINLQNYCMHYLPGSKNGFAFIDEWINKMKCKRHLQNMGLEILKLELKRLPIDCKDMKNEQQLIRGARIIFSIEYFHGDQVLSQKEINWKSAFVEICNDPVKKTELMLQMMRDRFLSDEDINKYLPVSFLHIMEIGQPPSPCLFWDMQLDFGARGYLDIPYDIYKKISKFVGPKNVWKSLEMVDRYTLKNANGSEIYRLIPKRSINVDIEKIVIPFDVVLEKRKKNGEIIELKPYVLLERNLSPKLGQKLSVSKYNEVRGWISGPSKSGIYQLLLKSVKEENGPEIFIEGRLLDLINQLYEETDEVEKPKKEIQIKITQHIKTNLKHLTRFCPLEKMSFFSEPDSNFISKIIFNPQGLSFTVRENSTGQRHAYSDQFPGFRICNQQYHPEIVDHPFSLLLENEKGKKKILISDNKYFAQLSFIKSLKGTFPQTLFEISQFPEFHVESSQFYTCDLDETDGGSKLISTDDKALAYLLIYHLCGLEFDKAEELCKQMEWLYHSKPIPDTFWPEISLLLFPDIQSPWSKYRQRLVAAREINKVIFPQKTEVALKNNYFKWAQNGNILLDLILFLEDDEHRNSITLTQEYFLYQHIFKLLAEGIKRSLPNEKTVHKYINQEFIEVLIECPPFDRSPLFRNYLELKKQLRIPRSANHALLNCVFRIAFAEVDLPEWKVTQTLFEPRMTMRDNPIFKAILSMKKINDCRNNSSLLGINCKQLHKAITPHIKPGLNLNPKKFIPDLVKTNFLSYYALMRGDRELVCLENNEFRPVKKEELRALLLRDKGLGDKTCQRLFDILLFVCKYPKAYPTTEQLLEAFTPPSVGISLAEPSMKKWEEFLSSLWQIVTFQELSKSVIEPMLGKQLVSRTLRSCLKGFRQPFQSNDLANGVLSVVQMQSDPLFEQASERYGSQLIELITGSSPSSTVYSLIPKAIATGVTVGASYYVMTRGGACVGNMINQVVQKSIPGLTSMVPNRFYATVPLLMHTGYNVNSAIRRKGSVGISDLLPSAQTHAFTLAAKTTKVLFKEGKIYWDRAVEKGRSYWNSGQVQFIESLEHPSEPLLEQELSMESLYRIDEEIDSNLRVLFELVFREEMPSEDLDEDTIRVPLLALPQDISPIQLARRRRINASISAFYDNPDRIKSTYHLDNEKGLQTLFIRLEILIKTLSDEINEEKQKLENALLIEFSVIKANVDNRQAVLFHSISRLNDTHLPYIRLAMSRIELKESRLQQMQQLLSLSSKLLTFSKEKEPQQYYELLNKLAIGLNTTTTYHLNDKNVRLTQLKIKFEAVSRMKLWEIQSRNLKRSVKGNRILEIGPGNGKTKNFIPEKAAEIGDGTQIAFPIFPEQLAGSNMPTVNMQMYNIYNKYTYALQFKRETVVTVSYLKGILAILNGSLIAGNPIQMTKKDSQTLLAIFIEHCYNYRRENSFKGKRFFNKLKNFVKRENAPDPESRQILILLHNILKIIRKHGIAIVDESHESYAHSKQHNCPIGVAIPIDEKYCMVMENVLREIFRCKDLYRALKENKGFSIDQNTYHTVHKKKIAENLSHNIPINEGVENPDEKLERQNQFVAFVCDELKYIPDWIQRDHPLHQSVGLVKGVLNDLLNFKNRASVNYDRIEEDKSEFCRPSKGNNGASIKDTIRSAFETFVKTNLMLIVKGLNKQQFAAMVKKLRKNAHEEIRKSNIKYEETKVFMRFGKYLTSALIQNENVDDFEIAYQALRQNADICLLYSRHFIREQIKYWLINIELNAHSFASMYKNQISCTGTPYNDGTYPAWLKMIHDPTTMGELLHIVYQRCPKDGIHVINSKNPRDTLNTIVTRFLQPGSSFSAIIDGGALFTGLSNHEVAATILAFCKEHRPDIDTVIYYDKDKNCEIDPKEIPYCIRINSPEPEPLSNVKHIPRRCITYYDDRHGFGADITQEGDGLETMGPNHPFYKWLQEIFRIRGLKKEHRLQAWENLIFTQQKIHFVMTKEIQNLILEDTGNPDAIPTLQEIVDYAVRNEAALAETENYPSMISKIQNVPFDAIYGEIMEHDSENIDRWFPLYGNFEELFVTKVEDDPAVLFGQPKEGVPTTLALQKTAKKTLKSMTKSKLLDDVAKSKISTKMDNLIDPDHLPPLPVEVIRNKSGNHLGMEQSVEVSADQTAEVEQDQDQDQDMDLDQDQNQQLHILTPHKVHPDFDYTEWNWFEIEDPSSLDMIRFEESAEAHRLVDPFSKLSCPLYKLKDLLAVATEPALDEIHHLFDERLWVSNNFLPRTVRGIVGGITQTPIEIGSPYQCHLTEVLVHFKIVNGQPQILYAGALSLKDAALWRSKLPTASDYWDQKEVKAVLWHVNLGVVQAGNPEYQELLASSEEMRSLMLQFKLIDGQVNLKADKRVLKAWLSKNPTRKMMEGLNYIATSRGRTFYGSYLNRLCYDSIPGCYITDAL